MKTKHITTHSTEEAWRTAASIFPTDYSRDSLRSQNAGYDIYHSTADGVSAWISDLGTRLEVNLPNGETVNVWIEEKEPEPTAEEIAEAIETRHAAERLRPRALYTPTVCQKVTVCIMGGILAANDDERRVYEGLKRGDPALALEVLTSYANTNGIKWGGIWCGNVTHYDHGKTGSGHYIIEGYISASLGEELDFLAKCADILNEQNKEHREESGKRQ